MSKQGGCSVCRLISTFLTLALIATGGYVAWFFLGQPTADELLDMAKGVGDKIKEIDFGDLTGALENFTGFTPELWDEDPFVGNNVTNLWRGYTKGQGGLSLQLLNALDETWQDEYAESVVDWNNWCPIKVLDLSSKDVEVDHKCDQVDGVMKVCAGNYGETGWLGINEVLKSVPAGIIQSSVAKMNEHYLLNADYDERLYTMCHELGHGYGLPHTDENFNNKDLANCLDYTNTPQNNLRPGMANCNRLLGMYGSIDGTIVGNETRYLMEDDEDYQEEGGPRKRSLRHRYSDAEVYEDEYGADEYDAATDDAQYYYEYARSQYPNMTAEYEEAMREFYYDVSQGNLLQQREEEDQEEDLESMDYREERGKWRRLREHPRGGDFSRRLNDGFVLEVHVLYTKN